MKLDTYKIYGIVDPTRANAILPGFFVTGDSIDDASAKARGILGPEPTWGIVYVGVVDYDVYE